MVANLTKDLQTKPEKECLAVVWLAVVWLAVVWLAVVWLVGCG